MTAMKWVLLVLLVFVLVALWTASYFFPELRWIPITLTVSLAIVVLFVVLVRWLRARARANAQRRSGDPMYARQLKARETRRDIRRALAALKRGGNSARAVPWLACVGVSGSGKTTLIERSGLPFAPVEWRTPKGTANAPEHEFRCFFSPEAMVMDVAGRLTENQSDRDDWMALLDALRSLRPERPLDALLIAISATDLLSLGEFDLDRAAANLKGQVYEALERLEMVLPVYCIVTKADLLGGFVEFWSGLSRADLGAPWGASFQVGDPRLAEPVRAIETEFDTLGNRVHARVLDRLPAERDPVRRAHTMRFPLEFRALGPKLARFVAALMRHDASRESFVFRGFYLASAQPQQISPTPGEATSYFLADLFRSVVLPDRGLGARSAAGARRWVRRELRSGLVALAVTLLALMPAIASYVHNAQLASDADEAVRMVESQPQKTQPGEAADPAELLANAVDQLDSESSDVAIPGWFGPWAARALLTPVRSAYIHRLHGWFLLRLRPRLERQLEAIGSGPALADRPSSVEDRTPLRQSYEAVKAYATFFEPKGHVDLSWTPQQLAASWRELLPQKADSVPPERLVKHATNYLAALGGDSALAWRDPSSWLRAARAKLKQADIRGLPYRRLKIVARDEPPIRASDVFSPASLEFLESRGDVQVPGVYTANAWAKIREALKSPQAWPREAVIERWVLGDESIPADEAALRDQMRSDYFKDYTDRWMTFLDELRVKTPPNVAAAKQELTAFKEVDGFYGSLFKQFKLNVIREEPTLLAAAVSTLASKLPWAKAEPEAGPKALPPTPVEDAFRPLLVFSGDVLGDRQAEGKPPLEKYRDILSSLQAALDGLGDQPNPNAQMQFSEASSGVARLLDPLEEPLRGRLRRLLMPPVTGGVQAAKVEGVGSMSDDWKSSVWSAWDEKLNGRFPFKKSGPEHAANFEDFTAFFKPSGGVLWGFVQGKLAGWVERTGSGGYVPKKGADHLSPELFECLNVAQEISDAFFREGDEPGLKVSLQADWSAPDVSGAKISIGAKETPLPRGQWSPVVRWLGEDVKLGWVQGGRPTQEIGRHAFPFFDLFQQLGGLHGEGARGIYRAELQPLTLKLRPEGKVDPLRPDFFSRLHCPQEIEMVKR
jgi:type VI secretion system protein ImpL